jgi:hypothetical protein
VAVVNVSDAVEEFAAVNDEVEPGRFVAARETFD